MLKKVLSCLSQKVLNNKQYAILIKEKISKQKLSEGVNSNKSETKPDIISFIKCISCT